MDGSQGTWHDVLTPDGYGRHWLAPDQGWSGIEFREVPDDSVKITGWDAMANPDPDCLT